MADYNLLNGLSNSPAAQSLGTNTFVTSSVYAPSVPPTNIDAAVAASGSFPVVRFPADTPKYYTVFSVSDYSRTDLNSINSSSMQEAFILPLPIRLVDSHNIQVDDSVELGLAATIATTLAGGSIQLFNSGKTQDQIDGNNAAFLATLAAELVGLGVFNSVKNALDFLTGGAVTGIVNSLIDPLRLATGYSPNQSLTVMLRGPTFKRFSLDFMLSANTAAESIALREIIRKINNYKSPTSSAGGLIFGFPKIWNIGFMPNSKYLYRFKPAVMENFMINYSGGGSPAFYKTTNAPETVSFTMQFLEMEFWLAGDFKDTNDWKDVRGNRPEFWNGT